VVEKGTSYYLSNHAFLLKMALLATILVLEVRPMLALIRWRIQLSRSQQPDTSAAESFAQISRIQAVLIVLMVCAAVLMARGIG
jgi:putative membrane protein